MRNIKIIVVLLIGFNFQVNAQFFKIPEDIKSPNAASLGRYGDLPVSYAYGTVGLNIPIYSLNNYGMALDVSLDYDSSGLRLNQPAGSVGINWSLATSGVITRSIRGTADEDYQPEFPRSMGGHFYSYNFLDRNDINTDAGLTNFYNLTTTPSYTTDREPDIFTFNFMGKTGKFFLGQDGTWKVQSESNLEVIINESDFFRPFNYIFQGDQFANSNTIGKITIKDDQGNIYYFGSTQNSIEFSTAFYRQKKAFASAWYLDEVIDRLGNTVYTFNYFRENPIASLFKFSDNLSHLNLVSGSIIFPVYLSTIRSKNETLSFSYSDSNALDYSNDLALQNKFQFIKNGGIDPVTLQLIPQNPNWPETFKLLYTNFNQRLANSVPAYTYSTWKGLCGLLKWKKLDKISITKNYGTLTKEVNFTYEETPTERLFLKKISFTGKLSGTTDTSQEYNFLYNSGYDSDYLFNGTLPGYLWRGVDHWGYYNSGFEPIYGATDISPYLKSMETNANLYYSKIGTLRKVIYPTGGYTQFEFEMNKASEYLSLASNNLFSLNVGSTFLVGGTRIKSIINIPDIDIDRKEIISYQYTNGMDVYSGGSSGKCSMTPYYIRDRFNVVVGSNLFSSGTMMPLSNFSGSHIQYSTVYEKKIDENGTFYTEYKYTDQSTVPDISYTSAVYPSDESANNIGSNRTDRSFLRGKLLTKNMYNSSNNLIKTKTFLYRLDDLESKTVKAFQWATLPHILYKNYYADYDVVKEINRDYLNNGTITTEINYDKRDFPYKNNGSDIFTGSRRSYGSTTTNSQGQILSNELKYQFDCLAGTNCFDNPIGLPKTSKNYNGTTLLSQEDITYRTLNSNPKSLVIDTVKKVKGGNVDGQKINYTKYDSYGNILEYNMENGSFTAFIYDNTGSDLLGKIENAKYIDLSSYLTTIMKSFNSSSSDAQEYQLDPVAYFNKRDLEIRNAFTQMRTNLTNAMITSYTYDLSHRLKSMTSPNGMVQFFTYDGMDRLTKITDKDGNILKTIEYNFKK